MTSWKTGWISGWFPSWISGWFPSWVPGWNQSGFPSWKISWSSRWSPSRYLRWSWWQCEWVQEGTQIGASLVGISDSKIDSDYVAKLQVGTVVTNRQGRVPNATASITNAGTSSFSARNAGVASLTALRNSTFCATLRNINRDCQTVQCGSYGIGLFVRDAIANNIIVTVTVHNSFDK